MVAFAEKTKLAESSRSEKRWGNKSLRKHRSYRVAVNGIKHILQSSKNAKNDLIGNSSNATVDSWASEKHVKSDANSDGIEILMKENGDGMELMHVMGTKLDDHGLPEPTIRVSYKQMKINYHPSCDFSTQHRIPTSRKRNDEPELTKAQKLVVLARYQISEEETATRDEIQRNLTEMRNLENERDCINQKMNSDKRLLCHKCSIPGCKEGSNINFMLDQVQLRGEIKKSSSANSLDWDFKTYLQKRRGAYFHASFIESNCRENFVKVCGGDRNDKTVHPVLQECSQEPFLVEKVAGSAAVICHVAINKGNKGTSFFVSKDDGKAYWDDCLPPRLIQRMESESDSSAAGGALRYFVGGPNNSYYAKLVSGQSFWSISIIDEEFKNVMDLFDVQRVAFGPFNSGPSWVIIGENGKVAWRNLPCRLDALLSRRTSEMAAPCEVSLGEYGSYFIRFLDGNIDYSLPAHIAASCQEILDQGADITNIALHPESSDSFIVRHTQLP